MEKQQLSGRVKWFSNDKGYGFIIHPVTGDDIFVHYTAITGKGYKSLSEDEEVTFELTKDHRGLQAANVVREKDWKKIPPAQPVVSTASPVTRWR